MKKMSEDYARGTSMSPAVQWSRPRPRSGARRSDLKVCWDDGTVEVTLKFATIIAVVIALAIGFDAGHFIWP